MASNAKSKLSCWIPLNVLPIVCGSSVFVFVLFCIVLCPF